MQISSERAMVLYDLADLAYDAQEIKQVSKALGRVPIIDPNKRRGAEVELHNSALKDNYGAHHVRVKGHEKVYMHFIFGVIVITVNQLFNIRC